MWHIKTYTELLLTYEYLDTEITEIIQSEINTQSGLSKPNKRKKKN